MPAPAVAAWAGPFAAALRHFGLPAALITLVFALIAHRLRAVELTGALAGATMSFLLYVSAGPGGFAVLAMVFALTTASTRLGRTRKQSLGLAERRHGRNSWQVLSNLIVAAVFAAASLYTGHEVLLLAAVAALAEAAADTVSSESGQALASHVWLITTFERVPVGADGGISVVGTLAGIAAAILVALTGAWCGLVPQHWIAVVSGAAVLGAFVDSVLGATLQRAGWLNNSAVNLLSTMAAAAIALAFVL